MLGYIRNTHGMRLYRVQYKIYRNSGEAGTGGVFILRRLVPSRNETIRNVFVSRSRFVQVVVVISCECTDLFTVSLGVLLAVCATVGLTLQPPPLIGVLTGCWGTVLPFLGIFHKFFLNFSNNVSNIFRHIFSPEFPRFFFISLVFLTKIEWLVIFVS